MYVFDATPLITLARADRLDLLTALECECVTTEHVESEVVETGLEEGYPDARRIRGAIDDGHIAVRSADSSPLLADLREAPSLSTADATVLTLAAAEDATAVMDEQAGRAVADAEGIATRGTAYLVLSLLRAGAIDPETGRATVDDMLEAGWYCSPDLYSRLSGKIDDLADSE